MELNAEQLRAVRARGSVLVAAGAGSGKTGVLVERYVAAVKGELTGAPIDPERILLVTFTEKAAAEMEARIRRRLFDERLPEAARSIQASNISTIHAFCARMLRANPFAAGIDPRFAVLDEARASALAEQAISESLDAFGGTDEARLDFLNAYGLEQLAADARRISTSMRAAGAQRASLPTVVPSDPVPLRVATLEAANDLGGCPGAGSLAQANRDRASALVEALVGSRVRDRDDGVLSADESLLWLVDRYAPHMGAAKEQRPCALRYKEALGALAEAQASILALRHHSLFEEILRLFEATYAAAKRAGGWLDFEDLQLVARQLLRSCPPVRERYRAQFELVMVDEFQDTNRLQADILGQLDTGELMTVGDIRQSIYGFRDADPGLFAARHGALSENPGAVVELPRTYRSHAGMVRAINAACGSDVLFGGDGMVLVPDDGRAELDPPELPRVELALFAVDPLQGADGARDAEAEWVAGRVAELLDSEEIIHDAAEQRQRPVRPGDIAILVRASSRIGALESALTRARIPFLSESSGGYYAKQEVGEVCAYLRVLVQPDDDRALLDVLRSPFARLSLDSLWLLRQHAGDRPLWAAVEDPEGAGLDTKQQEALRAFTSRMSAARESLGRVPLAQLMERIFVDSGYDLAALLVGANGPARWANLRKLMDLAAAFEEMSGADPLGFVAFVEAQAELATREGVAAIAEEGVDAVRIMTIHAAKGLQFPIVLLADTGSGHGRGAARAIWRPGPGFDSERGARFAMVLHDPAELDPGGYRSAEFLSLLDQEKDREAEEEKRCLYVAMTRAEQRLIISGHLNWDKKSRGWAASDVDLLAQAFGIERGEPDENGRCGLDVSPADDLVRVTVIRCEQGDEVAEARGATLARGAGASASAEPQSDRARLEAVVRQVLTGPEPFVPAQPAQVLGRASFSSIAAFVACPYRYFLERVAYLPLGKSGETRGLTLTSADYASAPQDSAMDPKAFGAAVHGLLERADLEGPGPDDEAVLAALKLNDPRADRAAVDRARWMIDAFLASPTAQRLREAARSGARVTREAAFSTLVGGTLVTGAIDVLIECRDRALAIDYKTSRLEATSPGDLFEAHYARQAEAYALALLASGARSVETEFVFLSEAQTPVLRTFEQSDHKALELSVLDVLNAMAAGPYAPLGDYSPLACSGCPGLGGLCPVDTPHR